VLYIVHLSFTDIRCKKIVSLNFRVTDNVYEIIDYFVKPRENKTDLAIIILTTMKFKYLYLVLQGNNNGSSIEYYKEIVMATTY